MKSIFILILLLLLSNCSLNQDSKFWTEETSQTLDMKILIKKKLPEILLKADDITVMTFDEYKIYIDDHTKKSKYPDINQ